MRQALTSLIVVLAFSTHASAADMAAKAPPPTPGCTWCGFYIGLNAGADFDDDRNVDTTSVNTFIAPRGAPLPGQLASAITALSNFSAPAGNTGFIGGGQIGYNWQWAPTWLVGLEADIQGVTGKGSSNVGSSIPINAVNTLFQSAVVSGGIDYLGTVRGRVGYVPTSNWLIYGTGGLAYGGVNSSTSIGQLATNAPNLVPPTWSGTGSFSDTRVGWVAGAGFEWMFLRNWTAKVEYLHYDLGSATYEVSPLVSNAPVLGGPVTINSVQSRVSYSGDIARVGINYLFH
jgi:outer membrane immunogenic protein